MNPSLLVVGSINMDLVLTMDQLPAPGENLVGDTYQYVCGGKGANQAVAASRLGADVTFVARVGNDRHGEILSGGLEGEGIDTARIGRDNGPSGLAIIAVESSGQNRIVVYPGANLSLGPEHVEEALQKPFHAVMLQLEVADDVVTAAVAGARARSIPVVLDAGPARKFRLSDCPGLDILSPNQSETEALTGMPCGTVGEAMGAAQELSERSDARAIVIKMGALGSVVWQEGAGVHVPPFGVDAVDPTAAGDAFTAALTVEWLRCGDLVQAARYGNAAGALAATTLGAQPSLPTKEGVSRLVDTAL